MSYDFGVFGVVVYIRVNGMKKKKKNFYVSRYGFIVFDMMKLYGMYFFVFFLLRDFF